VKETDFVTSVPHSGSAAPAVAGAIPEETVPRTGRPRRSRVAAFVALTKPRIIELLLVTTIPTMFLAQGGFPSWWLVFATLLGGTLAAGSANTLNCYIDRDIDVVMNRTKNRPLVTGEVTPREALVFGIVLGIVATVWLTVTVNALSAVLALAAILFYVLVYTMGLKRRTPQNIVWGGAAGCMPVLIGWSSVTNSLSWASLVLFGIIFLWTPPHYWPLSMRFARDYSAVGVPMLGAVERPERVARQIVAYSWAMVACSLLLIPVAPTGPVYAGAAVLLGAWFLVEAHLLDRRAHSGKGNPKAMRVFHLSITYLTLLFVAIAVDPFVRF
jgi:protoheme IX farnesyltransferase